MAVVVWYGKHEFDQFPVVHFLHPAGFGFEDGNGHPFVFVGLFKSLAVPGAAFDEVVGGELRPAAEVEVVAPWQVDGKHDPAAPDEALGWQAQFLADFFERHACYVLLEGEAAALHGGVAFTEVVGGHGTNWCFLS